MINRTVVAAKLVVLTLVMGSTAGCAAMMLAGEAVRSGQRDVDFMFTNGATAQTLKGKKKLGISVQATNQSTGQYPGSGNGTAVFSDLIAKDFLKLGYGARTISQVVSEDAPANTLKAIAAKGTAIVLIGNMNLAMSTSYASAMTGGNYLDTGVISFTVKGLDPLSGEVLFILSAEYGTARSAAEVAKDLAQIYDDAVNGRPIKSAKT